MLYNIVSLLYLLCLAGMLGSAVAILLMLMCITYPVTESSSDAVKNARAWEKRTLITSVKILLGSIVGMLLIVGGTYAYFIFTMRSVVESL